MLNFLKSAVDDASANQRAKISAIYIVLLAASALVWIWALIALAGRPTLLGTYLTGTSSEQTQFRGKRAVFALPREVCASVRRFSGGRRRRIAGRRRSQQREGQE